MSSSAYGASFAGGAFDFVGFLKQPQTILRCLSWVSDDTDTLASGLASCQGVAPNRCELLLSALIRHPDGSLAPRAVVSGFNPSFRLKCETKVSLIKNLVCLFFSIG